MNNHTVYANEELNNWVEREGLIPQEKYLLDKYLLEEGKLIEAGTGGGRISLEIMNKNGSLEILAFDFVEEMIESAKIKSNKIDFKVADATDLSFLENETFDIAIYLQQIISLIPYTLIPKALDESYRILKKDGVILFSFLYFKGRKINPLLSFITNTIRVSRGESWQKCSLPWLKLAGKANFRLFAKGQAMTYWFEKDEIVSMLEKRGFTILEMTTSKKIAKQTEGAEGMLYIVCKK
jgi:ubiquinone/menaquinone biosynthesis C-methylase UbiE